MKKHLGLLVVISIALAVIIPYFNSLQNPFIWDEEVIIIKNPIIKDWQYLPYLFKTDIFTRPITEGGFYRPIYMISFMVNYHLWGLDVVSYHLFSVVLHILNALLLYVLLLKLGLRKKVAWLSSALFAVFPVNSEAVTPIATRDGLIASLLSLLCILFFINGTKRSRLYFLWSVLIFILAVFTKESILVLPFIIMAYAFIFLEKDKRRKAVFVSLALLGIAIIYCVFRFIFVGNPFHRTLSLVNEASFLERLYTLPRIVLIYLQLIVAPVTLKSEYHFVVSSFKDAFVWLGAPLLVLLFISSYKFSKQKKLVLFFLCWFLIGLAPYLNILMPLHATLMEHWVYFSSMAFAALASMLFFGILDSVRSRWLRRMSVLVLASLMMLYAARIIQRNKEWGDPFTLYKNDVAREPDSFLLHCNLGVEYFRRGMMEDAKKEFMASNEASPGDGYDIAYNNLGVIYAREGKLQEAAHCYEMSIALNNYALAYENIGGLYNRLGMHKEAILLLEKARQLYPLNTEIKHQLEIAKSSL